MSFSMRNLSVLAYANGFTLWHYKCGGDPLSIVKSAGYFSDAADLLCEGDMVMLSGAEGGSICCLKGEGRRISLNDMADKLRPTITIGADYGREHQPLAIPPAPPAQPTDAYILTASGGRFEYGNPDNSTYMIEDIAFALAGVPRFTGHAARPKGYVYSVAQHSVLAAAIVMLLPECTPRLAMATLLHDASEAFMSDIASPLKRLLPDYKALEKRVQSSIFSRFGIELTDEEHAIVTRADLVMLATEKRDLMPHDPQPWPILKGVPQMAVNIDPWPAVRAEDMFLRLFKTLHAACAQPVAALA